MSAFYNAYALVGCGWNNGSAGGLWCWNFTELSSAYGVVGARLIILRYSLWDLMCFVLIFFSLHILLLLSAVVGTTLPGLACGVGIVGLLEWC